MIYPSFGVSIFVHMVLLAVGKTTGFKKDAPVLSVKNTSQKAILAFLIAIILEAVTIFVISSFFAAVYFSAKSENSNLRIIENFVYSINHRQK